MDWKRFESKKLLVTVLSLLLFIGFSVAGAGEVTQNAVITVICTYLASQGVIDTSAAVFGNRVRKKIDSLTSSDADPEPDDKPEVENLDNIGEPPVREKGDGK